MKSSDTSDGIYADFLDLYNEGQEPAEISGKPIQDNKDLINNPDDRNKFWFVLVLVLWETKSPDREIYEKIKSIIDSGKDLKY